MDKENQKANEQVLDSWDQELNHETKSTIENEMDQCKSNDGETNKEDETEVTDDKETDDNQTEAKKPRYRKELRSERRARKLREAGISADGAGTSKDNKKKVQEPTEVKEDELFIKNLWGKVDDGELLNQFKPFGTITKAHIPKDASGKSKGFGFVCFATPEEASIAMSEMNGKKIGKKAISIAFGQVKLGQRGPKATDGKKHYPQVQGPTILKQNELHISNLEEWVDNNELINQFKKFGNIKEARVVRDTTDKSKGFAFLCFDTHDEANRAMTKMNGQVIGETAIVISSVEQKPGQKGCNPREADKKYKKDRIFVKNLDESVTEEELKSIFTKFGNIIDVNVSQFEGKGRGYIQFFSYKAAEKAIIEMNGRMIKEKAAFVTLAELVPGKTISMKPKPTAPLPVQKDNVFISNLPKRVTSSRLKELFRPFGNIVQVKLVQPQNIAFVQFVLPKDAQQAVNLMNGHILDSKPLKVTLATQKPGKSNDPFYMPKKPSNDPFYSPKSSSNKALYEDMY